MICTVAFTRSPATNANTVASRSASMSACHTTVRWGCLMCFIKFYSEDEFRLHVNKHHGNSSSQTLFGPWCPLRTAFTSSPNCCYFGLFCGGSTRSGVQCCLICCHLLPLWYSTQIVCFFPSLVQWTSGQQYSKRLILPSSRGVNLFSSSYCCIDKRCKCTRDGNRYFFHTCP